MPSEKQVRVVIVDDSPFMGDLLSAFFSEKLGYSVVASGTNGMHAVSLYKQHRPDLLTMDLTMPIKDGKTALKEILSEHPEARILMVTSQVGPQIVECLKLGAVGYVEKPLQFENPKFIEDFTATLSRALSP